MRMGIILIRIDISFELPTAPFFNFWRIDFSDNSAYTRQ